MEVKSLNPESEFCTFIQVKKSPAPAFENILLKIHQGSVRIEGCIWTKTYVCAMLTCLRVVFSLAAVILVETQLRSAADLLRLRYSLLFSSFPAAAGVEKRTPTEHRRPCCAAASCLFSNL